MSGFVYFIQRGEAGPIKIGQSKNPKARLASLQTASDQPLRFVAIATGDKQSERELHAKFASARLTGEWFSPTEELIEHARAIGWVPGSEVATDDLETAFKRFQTRWQGDGAGLINHLASALPASTFDKILALTAEKVGGDAVRALLQTANTGAPK